MMDPDKLKDRFRGCLIGGAAGDALGYPVEFQLLDSIHSAYGKDGITSYHLFRGFDRALVSDDTQMTLFTANGLLCYAAKEEAKRPADVIDCIREAYMDWLYIQLHPVAPHPFGAAGGEPMPDPKKFHSWLMTVPWLLGRRAPGSTCMSALEAGGKGTMEAPANASKGCGGVMRTAPPGLYASTPEEALVIGAKAAAVTHGNPLGYIPAGTFSYIIHGAAHTDEPLAKVVRAALNESRRYFKWSTEVRDACGRFTVLVERALNLAEEGPKDSPEWKLLSNLGQGWVGEEALAIAVFCAVRHEHDFEKCIIAAVNHSGDSDSTGAIAGNLLGARVGLAGIPPKFTELLEGIPEMTILADDLFNKDHPDDEWRKRYLY